MKTDVAMAIEVSGRALVVLLHGFLGGRIQFVPMASMLASKHDVLNYGYRSREDTIEGHSQTLLDTLYTRVQQDGKRRPIHFVTHSFGGVVLHRAFKDGLADILSIPARTRCVMLAPPLRGASLARAFRKEQLGGPTLLRDSLHSAARTVLGQKCGAQLMLQEADWFERSVGTIPSYVDVLVIAGNTGRINPLIDEESDGVVGVGETMLNRPHFRKNIWLTHNLMLFSREVWSSVGSFLDGEDVGELKK